MLVTWLHFDEHCLLHYSVGYNHNLLELNLARHQSIWDEQQWVVADCDRRPSCYARRARGSVVLLWSVARPSSSVLFIACYILWAGADGAVFLETRIRPSELGCRTVSACYVAVHAFTVPPSYCVISDDNGADFVRSDLHLSAYRPTTPCLFMHI